MQHIKELHCIATGRIHDFFAQLRDNISQSFLPRKEDVTSDYWEWLRWRLGQVCLDVNLCV